MRAPLTFKIILTLLVAGGVVAGCGFELRGTPRLPEGTSSVYVRAPVDIATELEVYLRDAGAGLARARQDAEAILDVGAERFDQRLLSVDPNTGKEREIEVSYAVSFSLTKTDGTRLLEPQTVTLLRDYVFDADQVLGKSREQGVLHQEMRRDAAQQILRRINAALSN